MITSQTFECKVRYSKMMEDGFEKTVTESYIMTDVFSFTEAKARIIEFIKPYVRGDFEVTSIRKSRFNEIVNAKGAGDRFFNCKFEIITLDEQKNREKRCAIQMLVRADTIEDAKKHFDEEMKNSIADYTLISVVETKFFDIV